MVPQRRRVLTKSARGDSRSLQAAAGLLLCLFAALPQNLSLPQAHASRVLLQEPAAPDTVASAQFLGQNGATAPPAQAAASGLALAAAAAPGSPSLPAQAGPAPAAPPSQPPLGAADSTSAFSGAARTASPVVVDPSQMIIKRPGPPAPTTANGARGGTPIRIVAIGDSITAGSRRTASYRFPLKNLLVKSGKNVELVGGGCDDCWAKKQKKLPHGHWCALSCQSEEDKYLGFWMWTAKQILDGNGPPKARTDGGGGSGLSQWIANLDFDVATIHLGTNGLMTTEVSAHVAHIAEIVRILQARNPKVKVFVAKIIPHRVAGEMVDRRMKEYNDALDSLTAANVHIVDCNSGFDREQGMFDRLHPNQVGAEFMAERFFKEMVGRI